MAVDPENAGLEEETGKRTLPTKPAVYVNSVLQAEAFKGKSNISAQATISQDSLAARTANFHLIFELAGSARGDSDASAGACLRLPGQCQQAAFWCEGRGAGEHAARASAEAQAPTGLPRLGKDHTACRGRDGGTTVALGHWSWCFSWLHEPFVTAI